MILCRSFTLFSSVQFSSSVMSNSLRPHELPHARPPCPSPTPRVHSNLGPSSQWCHPAISSYVIPFSSCPQSLPASGSFPSIGVSALASVLPMNTQDWSPLGWTASFTILNFSKAFHKVSCNALTNKINLCELNYDLGSKLFKLLFPRQVINNST